MQKPGSVLSDIDILQCIASGDIALSPYSKSDAKQVLSARQTGTALKSTTAKLLDKMLQPASIDVVLDKSFSVFNSHKYSAICPWKKQPDLTRQRILQAKDIIILHPHEFALGSTFEHVKLPSNIVARFEGKSSLGRVGLATHITAGFIDPGFNGNITVELKNNNVLPIELKPGMKIGQFAFEYLTSNASHEYGSDRLGSHYYGQTEATPARFSNFHTTDVYQNDKNNRSNANKNVAL
jgi:dCTP deaminase